LFAGVSDAAAAACFRGLRATHKREKALMSESASDVLITQAAAYVRGRPEYPAAIEDWLRRDIGLGLGKTAVDLGSGTGKFLPRLKATGARVIAIEPLAQMRAHLVALHPDVEAREGRAPAIPLPDGCVDAVICAQCFHLFATTETTAEIRRVLKPGGALGLVWNIRDKSVPWVAGVIDIMAPYDHNNVSFEAREWRTLFPAPGFSVLQEQTFSNPQTGAAENVIIDRVLSVSAIARLPRETRNDVVARLKALIDSTPELARKQEVTFPNTTYAYYCRKLA
jgi:SAM-dependent methyltransferase